MRTLGVTDPRMGGREPEQQRRGAAARELAAAVAAALQLLAPRARSAPPHGETHPKAPTSAPTFGSTWTKVIDNALEHPFREDAHKMHMLPEKLAVLIFIRLEENDNLVLTPFEKNIDIYRQL
ncbi:unnamed protein product [Urochloa humidicola]